MSSKIIKPFYNTRVASSMQKTALEVAERNKQLLEGQVARSNEILEQNKNSTFSKMKTSSQRRREANNAKKISFQESLSYIVSKATYKAMPVDSKKPLLEGKPFSEQPAEFKKLFESVQDMFRNDPEVSASVVGDAFSRTSTLDIGSTSGITASQYAINIAGKVNLVAERLSDNPNPASFTVVNVIDQLLYHGDSAGGLPKDPTEQMCESFIDAISEKVEEKVLVAIKEESDRSEMEKFLSENYSEDMYAKNSNRLLEAKTKKSSVFQEVTMTVFAKNMAVGEFTKDELLGEAIVHYTLLETLNTLDFLNKTPDQVISECIRARLAVKAK